MNIDFFFQIKNRAFCEIGDANHSYKKNRVGYLWRFDLPWGKKEGRQSRCLST